MKKLIVSLVFTSLLLLSTGWNVPVNAATSTGDSWVDNHAKVTPELYEFLKEEASVASYIYTERTIDLNEAKKLFWFVNDGLSDDMLYGDVDRDSYFIQGKDTHGNGLLITRDGLIVNFFKKEKGINEYFYDDEFPLDTRITSLIEELIGPTVESMNHVNFQQLEAAKFSLVEPERFNDDSKINVPANVEIDEFQITDSITGDAEFLNADLLQPGKSQGLTMDGGTIYLDNEKIYDATNGGFLHITYSGSDITYEGDLKEVALNLEDKFQHMFYDVGVNNTHYEGVMSLAGKKIISGYKNGDFKPWNKITRNQVAVMLSRASNLKTPTNLNEILYVYEDVSSDTPYAEEIAAVTKANIFKGSNGLFNPRQQITREQMASVLVSALDLEDYDMTNNVHINLNNVSPTHQDNVQIIANLGITDRLDDFNPSGKITRAAFSTQLHAALNITK